MAGSVNKVILVGNLGKDPEIRRTQDGRPIANLSIATSETWRDKATGERKEKTEWHRVVIFNEGLCKVAEQYLKKGAKVYIEGQLQTRKWTDQSGVEKYSTEVVLQGFNSTLTMLDGRSGGGGGSFGSDDAGGDFGSGGPSSAAPRRAVAAGGAATATWTTIFRSESAASRAFAVRQMLAEYRGRDRSGARRILDGRFDRRIAAQGVRSIGHEPRAAARCRSRNSAACLRGDGRLRARPGPVCRAEGDVAASDLGWIWVVLMVVGRGQFVLDPPDPAGRARGARSICCRSSR